MNAEYIFTSQSVTDGHPDKLCDQMSDALVGNYLLQDPTALVAAECAVSTGIVFVSIKSSADAMVDVPNTAREVIRSVGYDRGEFSFRNCTVMTTQTEMAGGANRLFDNELDRLASQDNVTVFGFACDHTADFMPLPIWLAHRLVQQLDEVRRGALYYLAPDGQCQVGVAFRNGTPVRIDSISLVTSQWKRKHPDPEELRRDLLAHVVEPVFAAERIGPDSETRIDINPEGPMHKGGPSVHAGLTGRKNAIDTYGGFARQSGAALSGKDPTRADRIGAYAARHAAKNVVAAGLAARCEVMLSYSIGQVEPASVRVESFGSGRMTDAELTRWVNERFDFRLGEIVRRFHLRELARACDGSFYRRLAVYGHVGRTDLELPWEKVDDQHAAKG
jgi:S-adenosylmethionine synthetase